MLGLRCPGLFGGPSLGLSLQGREPSRGATTSTGYVSRILDGLVAAIDRCGSTVDHSVTDSIAESFVATRDVMFDGGFEFGDTSMGSSTASESWCRVDGGSKLRSCDPTHAEPK